MSNGLPVEVVERDKKLQGVDVEMSDSERLEMWARLANSFHHRSLTSDTPALDGFWAGTALNEANMVLRPRGKLAPTQKQWSAWLKSYFDGSAAVAKRYQALADGYGLPEFVDSELSVGAALMKLTA